MKLKYKAVMFLTLLIFCVGSVCAADSRCHYVFDCKTNNISTIAISDVYDYESYEEGDWVLMYAWKGKVKDVIVYRNFASTRTY